MQGASMQLPIALQCAALMQVSTSSQPSCVLLHACRTASVQRKVPGSQAAAAHVPLTLSHRPADAQTCSLVQPSCLALHDCSTGPTHCSSPSAQMPTLGAAPLPPLAVLPPLAALPPLAVLPP